MNNLEYITECLVRPDSFAVWSERDLFKTWGISHIARHRDSSILQESNYDVSLERLREISPEGEGWEILHCTHWAVGWMDHVIFDTTNEDIVSELVEIYNERQNYCILDEDEYSQRCHDAICEYWENESVSDRLEYCQETQTSIFAARHKDIIPEKVYDYLRDWDCFN